MNVPPQIRPTHGYATSCFWSMFSASGRIWMVAAASSTPDAVIEPNDLIAPDSILVGRYVPSAPMRSSPTAMREERSHSWVLAGEEEEEEE